jgi:hypothetical protein
MKTLHTSGILTDKELFYKEFPSQRREKSSFIMKTLHTSGILTDEELFYKEFPSQRRAFS